MEGRARVGTEPRPGQASPPKRASKEARMDGWTGGQVDGLSRQGGRGSPAPPALEGALGNQLCPLGHSPCGGLSQGPGSCEPEALWRHLQEEGCHSPAIWSRCFASGMLAGGAARGQVATHLLRSLHSCQTNICAAAPVWCQARLQVPGCRSSQPSAGARRPSAVVEGRGLVQKVGTWQVPDRRCFNKTKGTLRCGDRGSRWPLRRGQLS